jgi:hypothetical protein
VVDFGTASAQNGVSITQEFCYIMVFFNLFSYEGNACKSKIRFVMQPMQILPLFVAAAN